MNILNNEEEKRRTEIPEFEDTEDEEEIFYPYDEDNFDNNIE